MSLSGLLEEVRGLVSGWMPHHLLVADLEYVPHVMVVLRRRPLAALVA